VRVGRRRSEAMAAAGRDATAEPRGRRLGPRPLALHLAHAASASCGPSGRRERLEAFLQGLRAYHAHPYRRDLPEPPQRWRRGTTRLLDYGREGGFPVLVVPSLVNRAHILDHSRERSLLRHLSGRGLRPLLVDWGAPGPRELGFALTDYVVRRLEPALAAARAATGRRPAVLGYCMGGLLAVALVQQRPEGVAGLALLATPWGFHADGVGGPGFLAAVGWPASVAMAAQGVLPVPLLQTLFAGVDPLHVPRKYARFAALDPASPAAVAFVALEDWANDGVPVAVRVGQECLLGWYGANTPERREWRIGGGAVRPERLRLPAFVAVPDRDRIVPPASALALARAIPDALVHRTAAGHVSMVVGEAAPRALWAPLTDWLRRLAAMQK
jgi:polyhydroxyalkanoate synthase subunit PhaC